MAGRGERCWTTTSSAEAQSLAVISSTSCGAPRTSWRQPLVLRSIGLETARQYYSQAAQRYEQLLARDPSDTAAAASFRELKRLFTEGGAGLRPVCDGRPSNPSSPR
jgi:hypothetical protein